LDYYDAKDLHAIIKRSARILNVDVDDAGAREIAGRSRGTPRIANNLLRWVRDYAQVKPAIRSPGTLPTKLSPCSILMNMGWTK